MLIRSYRLPVWVRGQRLLHTPLKTWQEDAIQACLNEIHAGRTKVGIQLGTAQRHTLTGLMDRMLKNLDVKQLLVVAAQRADAGKLAERLSQDYPEWTADVYSRKIPKLSHADIFLTSYKNMEKDAKLKRSAENEAKKSDKKQKVAFVPRYEKSAVKAVILCDIDEYKPHSFDSFLSHLRPPCPPDEEPPPLPIIISTSSKEDLNSLRYLEFIETVAYRRTFLDDIQETWKCDALFSAVPTPLGLRKCTIRLESFFQPQGLSKVMRRPPIIKQVVKQWQDLAGDRKSTLVYCVDEPHVTKLALAFKQAGIDAREVMESWIGAKPGTEGHWLFQKQMADFKGGEFPVLLVSHGKEVVDVPEIDCVLMAAPAVDRNILASMISSGMRLSSETSKENCLIIEMVDGNITRCRGYSLKDLFQLPPQDIDKQPPSVLRERAQTKARLAFENAPPKPKAVVSPETDVELLPASGQLHEQATREHGDETLETVNRFKKRRWVLCAPGVYVYDCNARGHAILRQTEGDLYEAYWTTRRLLEGTDAKENAGVTHKLSVPGKLDDILAALADFMRNTPARPAFRKMKATPSQIELLKELYPVETMSHVVLEGKPMVRDAFFEWLSVGEASNAIARIRYRANADYPPFSYEEQVDVVKRIRINEGPGEKMAAKKAIAEEARARRREAHENQIAAHKRERELRELKARQKLEAEEAARENGEADIEAGDATPVESEKGENREAEIGKEEDGEVDSGKIAGRENEGGTQHDDKAG
ncbi:hypothetical protein DFH08DRAFT_870242 [Mycena albidolilacea]|uniref:Uncharacterized protein n=1 Tax=Mycena albidolilacea TaxID=1033008 RepID=A0AAD7ER66_9AGAR|nr:hypothetical protein DFH08DRAFT_870242 [Mycena albidolilacea]